MRLLDRYLLRQIWLPTALASLVIAVVVVGGAIQQQVNLLLREFPIAQITLWDLSRLSVFSLPALVGYIVPVTFLMGIMVTFSRLAENHELTAMKSAGIPLKRIVAPAIGAGILLSVVCFVIQDQGQAWAYRQMNALFATEMPLRMTIDMLPVGAVHEYGKWRVYVGRKDEKGDLCDIVIVQPQEDGQAMSFYAERAGVRSQGAERWIELQQGFFIRPSKQGEKLVRMPFEKFELPVPPLTPPPAPADRKSMSLRELLQSERDWHAKFNASQANSIGQFEAGREWYKTGLEIGGRFAFPLMCLSMALMGAPAGARIRRAGRSFAFAGGFAIVVFYFVLRDLFEPPLPLPLPMMVLVMQGPNLVLCALGAIMTWRVDRV